MARPLRANFKNGWYHVTNRGNNRERVFLDERDRRHFLQLLGQMIERLAVQVHAYVLMDNHYHLLVRTPEANLSRFERRLVKDSSLRRMAERILSEQT